MNRPLLRVHPVCKFVLALGLMALGFPCWNTIKLIGLCALIAVLLLADYSEGLVGRMLKMTTISVGVFGVTYIIGNPVIVAFGAALHLELLLFLSLFMMQTPVSELLRGLQSCHVPDALLLGFIIVFRFISVLFEELSDIKQAASMLPKGALPLHKKAYRCLIIPFTYRLFSLSDQLTVSVCSRDFGTTQRTQYCANSVRVLDVAATCACVALGGTLVWLA